MFVVVLVWFCCSSWLAFLILTYYSNLMHQFLLHWVICCGGYLIVHTEFFEKDLDFFGIRKKYFLGFSICLSFGRQLCQNCGWAGSEPYVPSHITERSCSNWHSLSIFRLYFISVWNNCPFSLLEHFHFPMKLWIDIYLPNSLTKLIWQPQFSSFSHESLKKCKLMKSWWITDHWYLLAQFESVGITLATFFEVSLKLFLPFLHPNYSRHWFTTQTMTSKKSEIPTHWVKYRKLTIIDCPRSLADIFFNKTCINTKNKKKQLATKNWISVGYSLGMWWNEDQLRQVRRWRHIFFRRWWLIIGSRARVQPYGWPDYPICRGHASWLILPTPGCVFQSGKGDSISLFGYPDPL